MVGLRALGLTTPSLPALVSPDAVARLVIHSDNELSFFEDNEQLARQCGDEALRRALGKCLRRYARKRLLRDSDRVLFRGRLQRWFRALAGAASRR
jgi:hypothetical protein